ncbi:hypothetical protein Mycch_5334 (plasmid) [Mycolicibacterium chubuense NBB4]|uniref:Thioesterase domain-containing protein n=2 Tax=Mycolicibacterium chubuense TaxID=1800 RepID=I4BRW0_MYCCN|nr:hypothetical protein Mycch_5334 [Mycolicibacterium chubuense NBB4]
MTVIAQRFIEAVPANRLARVEVLRAVDGHAVVAMDTAVALTNVIGSLHSAGLAVLVDAVGLAAIVSTGAETDFEGIVPLSRATTLKFLEPARGRLTASCSLKDNARAMLDSLWSGANDRARFSTHVVVTNSSGALVCRGSLDWSLRAQP